ncbi:MAG: histidine phosphatase family protein [Candidatus Gracilibacteria bacterium]
MKKLILIRHAKSGFKNTDMIDFDRPLSDRGIEETKFVGKILKKLDIKTDLILCSSAKRTRETLEGIREEIDADNEKIVYDKGIYDNNSTNLDYYLNLFSKIDNDKEIVVIIGHNPFVTRLVRYLSGNDNLGMETLGVAILDFDIEKWEGIKSNKGNISFFLSPKNLME